MESRESWGLVVYLVPGFPPMVNCIEMHHVVWFRFLEMDHEIKATAHITVIMGMMKRGGHCILMR